ncbi:Chitin deacetylase [Mycena kentingensis (nom. inval.)]|nr:Chitin deacetylase [Mycena kentingensis (nom. inval.)]
MIIPIIKDWVEHPPVSFAAMRLTPTLFALPALSLATLLTHRHEHSSPRRLPDTWFQPDEHPAHALFKRAPATDGATYDQVGSSTWSAAYPQSTPSADAMPSEWKDALAAAVSAGKIPKIPSSSNKPGENPTYPTGFDPNGNVVCSATYKCRNSGDVWDAPDGVLGVSFDDGPQPASDTLMDFLDKNNETATHFLIGVNVLQFPQQFLRAYNMGGDLAVHTCTHPYMTTLSNEDVVAQLGWTMQIIHNSSGGRVPAYWRPPFGDSDNRVRAIAKEVFGLTTVIWNQDTEDWSLTTGGTTLKAVNTSMQAWITGPKSPGLIILEHELSEESVSAFVSAYPVMKANSWKVESLAQIIGGSSSPYQNAVGSSGEVTKADILVNNAAVSNSASGSKTASATSQPSTTTNGSGTSTSASTGASTSPSGGAVTAHTFQSLGLLLSLFVPALLL